MSFVCTPSCWTHDWLAVWGKRAALANETWWRRSWNAGGLSIKTLLSVHSSAEPQVRISANLQTRTATNLRWVQLWSILYCLLKIGWREWSRETIAWIDWTAIMSSTGKQRDAESRDSASGVCADHLSDVRLAGSSVQVHSLQRRSRKNEFKFCLCPVPLNTTVFSEPVKSLWQMESHYRAQMHRGCSTPSRSFCRYLWMNKTSRQLMETGIVWLSTAETHTCLLEKLHI